MPPKVQNAGQNKGQTSLFSFFQKPAHSVGNTNVAPKNVSSKVGGSEAKGAASPPSTEKVTTGSVHRRNTVIDDDDIEDEEAIVLKKQSLGKSMTAKKPLSDEEDEWDPDDTSEDDDQKSGNSYSSDENYSMSESNDDENEDESGLEDSESSVAEDDDVLDDSSLENGGHARKKRRLRKGSAKPTRQRSRQTATRPRGKSIVRASQPAVTPDPRSSAATPNQSLVFFEGTSAPSIAGSTPRQKGGSHGSAMITPGSTGSATAAVSSFFSTPASAAAAGERVTPATGASATAMSQPDSLMKIDLPEGVVGRGSHEHNSFSFLLPENRKDNRGRRPDHQDFNPRTLFVPPDFLKKQTPAMAQWWIFKAENMDTVLFFKVGKFYELFHMDADVGFAELDLIYMKGTKAHSGFPEVSYGKFASALVTKGYRVARVEQTETPDMLKERNDSAAPGKKAKVVARELCSVMSRGTRTYCHLDDISLLQDAHAASDTASSVLICIKEQLRQQQCPTATAVAAADNTENGEDEEESVPEYGVCCVDTVIGTVTLAQFEDDQQRSRLRTLLARYRPTEVLLECGAHSAHTVGALRLLAPRAAMEYLRPHDEMPTAERTITLLKKGQYYEYNQKISNAAKNGPVDVAGDFASWPPVMQAVVTGMQQDQSSALVLSAIGGVLWQLRRSLIDFEVLSLGKVFAYIPPDETVSSCAPLGSSDPSTTAVAHGATGTAPHSQPQGLFSLMDQEHHEITFMDIDTENAATTTVGGEAQASASDDPSQLPITNAAPLGPKYMTLDEVALSNLEILVNNYDRTERGSLWAFVNHSKTAFGRRLLRSWLCHPLYRVSDINRRQDAVGELMQNGPLGDYADRVRALSKNIPDLERLLARVHSNGLRRKGPVDHPDSRAILYENPNMRKIRDFADLLSGFETVLKICNLFADASVESTLVRIAVKPLSEGGKFPRKEVTQLLRYFREIFDEQQAKKEGNIRPRKGIDPDYDAASAEIGQVQGELEAYLREVKRSIGVSDLRYFGSGKDRYQIEVPMAQASKVPRSWTSKSQKKTHRRYWTPRIEELLAQLTDAEERLLNAQKDTLRRVFEKFDDSAPVWATAVSCMALLDALLALSLVSSFPNYNRPHVHVPGASSSDVAAASAGDAAEAVRAADVEELHIVGGRHPMLEFALAQRGDGDCIANDLKLGGTLAQSSLTQQEQREGPREYLPKMLLLSGPNMGGKSTLLRQTCLITVLAQIGCWVPADSVSMTPVDRIFTRVGASDRILSGQSTFFVELAETAIILNCATTHSLCILDELGRGTATFDGTAIAHSVVEHLVSRPRCRALFATHYHSLVDDWEMDPRVLLGHMDCIVHCSGEQEQEQEQEGAEQEKMGEDEEVTFLYKLCDGSSPRSYGINVARLAGLPPAVIALALKQSREFEQRMKQQAAGTVGAAAGGTADSDTLSSSTSSSSSSTAAAAAHATAADKILSIFERLVSIAQTQCSVHELAFLAAEMWRRVNAMDESTHILTPAV